MYYITHLCLGLVYEYLSSLPDIYQLYRLLLPYLFLIDSKGSVIIWPVKALVMDRCLEDFKPLQVSIGKSAIFLSCCANRTNDKITLSVGHFNCIRHPRCGYYAHCIKIFLCMYIPLYWIHWECILIWEAVKYVTQPLPKLLIWRAPIG